MTTLFRVLAVVVAIYCAIAARDCIAEVGAISLVSPSMPDTLASTVTFRSVQSSTEADSPALSLTSAGKPHWLSVGIDSWIGGRVKTYDLPLAVAFTPSLLAQLDIPLVTATTDSYTAGRKTETGLGDIVFSLKYLSVVEDMFESYYIFSAKFASGATETGLGTGSTDFSFTHKTILMLGDYRTTLMVGVTIPPPTSVLIQGSSVEYAPTISYMAATERRLSNTALRFGLKAAGLHAFNSRVNSELQQNGVTTLDIIPEVTYHLSDAAMIKTGIIIPALTLYDLPGATNSRGPIVDLNVQWFF